MFATQRRGELPTSLFIQHKENYKRPLVVHQFPSSPSFIATVPKVWLGVWPHKIMSTFFSIFYSHSQDILAKGMKVKAL